MIECVVQNSKVRQHAVSSTSWILCISVSDLEIVERILQFLSLLNRDNFSTNKFNHFVKIILYFILNTSCFKADKFFLGYNI